MAFRTFASGTDQGFSRLRESSIWPLPIKQQGGQHHSGAQHYGDEHTGEPRFATSKLVTKSHLASQRKALCKAEVSEAQDNENHELRKLSECEG